MSAVEQQRVLSLEEQDQEEERAKWAEIDKVLNTYRNKPGSLIQILHNVQNIYGYLPLIVQEYIANHLHMSLSEVSGVVTFYALFSTTPRADHSIKVCMGTACYVRGGNRIVERLVEELAINPGQNTPDGKFSIEICRCLGACGLAPVIMIDEDVHQQVNPDKIEKILARY